MERACDLPYTTLRAKDVNDASLPCGGPRQRGVRLPQVLQRMRSLNPKGAMRGCLGLNEQLTAISSSLQFQSCHEVTFILQNRILTASPTLLILATVFLECGCMEPHTLATSIL